MGPKDPLDEQVDRLLEVLKTQPDLMYRLSTRIERRLAAPWPDPPTVNGGGNDWNPTQEVWAKRQANGGGLAVVQEDVDLRAKDKPHWFWKVGWEVAWEPELGTQSGYAATREMLWRVLNSLITLTRDKYILTGTRESLIRDADKVRALDEEWRLLLDI